VLHILPVYVDELVGQLDIVWDRHRTAYEKKLGETRGGVGKKWRAEAQKRQYL